MKKIYMLVIATVLLQLTSFISSAQSNNEDEIRKLEDLEGQSWVKKDTAMLFKLFSPQLVVNTPLNKVVTLDVLKKLVRGGKIDASSIKKMIEKISFINGMAVVMGQDVIMPQGQMENSGKTVTRRYTDVWIKDKGDWRLTIRQATIISIE